MDSGKKQQHPTVDEEMESLVWRLYPLFRSIAGPGLRDSLRILQEQIPLTIHEVPSGTPVLDWKIPQEWILRDAFVKDAAGNRIIDVRQSNLHVVSHSRAVQQTMRWDELRSHIATLPDRPDSIPYRTAFFQDRWGFCMQHGLYETLDQNPAAEYDVCIDASFVDGSLSYGELLIEGTTDEEVLIYAHTCHPMLANDNLSGMVVATFLAQELLRSQQRYTYRFVFAPATIGAIAWLAEHRDVVANIAHGLVVTLLGMPHPVTYKRSRQQQAAIDRTVEFMLEQDGWNGTLRDFEPWGYDERQFCSPGFDLPVGCLMRHCHGEFPEYHTSDDHPDRLDRQTMNDSLAFCRRLIEILEHTRRYKNRAPWGEPMLGQRGLYTAFGTRSSARSQQIQRACLWTLNLSDGNHDLLEIARRSQLPFDIICESTRLLEQHDLLEPVIDSRCPPAND